MFSAVPTTASIRRITLLLFGTALLLSLLAPGPRAARAQSEPDQGWQADPTFAVTLLGRDGPDGKDHYNITLKSGASFFGIADGGMPLVPVQQAIAELMAAFAAGYPDRPNSPRPSDSFDLYVPQGTLVGNEWRKQGNTLEFRSLRGDHLAMYTDYRSPILYRLERAGNPGWREFKINHDVQLEAYSLAQALYSTDKPDFLQVIQASEAIQKKMDSVTVDATQPYMDDFREIRDASKDGGDSPDGLRIYFVQSEDLAQPFFRVDDGIGDLTDPRQFPSLMRVYYYKNGVVKTYQKSSDSVWVSGRQPRGETWTKAYADYGRITPSPTRWGVGQPEESEQARQLGDLGISVIRYDPQAAPQGNFLTQLLEAIMGLMKRKD